MPLYQEPLNHSYLTVTLILCNLTVGFVGVAIYCNGNMGFKVFNFYMAEGIHKAHVYFLKYHH